MRGKFIYNFLHNLFSGFLELVRFFLSKLTKGSKNYSPHCMCHAYICVYCSYSRKLLQAYDSQFRAKCFFSTKVRQCSALCVLVLCWGIQYRKEDNPCAIEQPPQGGRAKNISDSEREILGEEFSTALDQEKTLGRNMQYIHTHACARTHSRLTLTFDLDI